MLNCVRSIIYVKGNIQKLLFLCNNDVISLPGFTVLSSRCLQLIVHYIPIIRAHFEARLQPKQFSMLRHFDHITKVILLASPEKQSSAFQLYSEEHECH